MSRVYLDASAIIYFVEAERVWHRFRTPDAIHLATAIEEHADVFLTGDDDLKRCTEVKVETLQA